MSTQDAVWVIINSDGVSNKIHALIDAGYFSEAIDFDYHLKAISDKIKHLVGEKGGSVHLSTYDRQVLELPLTVAEELPLILSGYKQVFGTLMATGIGLNITEASLAAKKSMYSNDIEMYDPKDSSYAEIKKTLEIEDDLYTIQPNQYDKTHPKSPLPDKDQLNVGKFVSGPSAQEQLQAENALIQATVQQLSGPAQQMQQQMEQQQQQQMQQQQANAQPSSLLEALSGEKKKDKPDSASKQVESTGKEKSKPDEESDTDTEEDSESTDKLGKLLASVQDKLPQLMDLSDKNPEAFKKVIGLVHKLVDMAKQKKSDTAKSEIVGITEELNKMIKLKFPAGSVRGRKKKVIINGKAVWRSVAAGQVKDMQGNAISVASHNNKADDGTEGARE